MQKNKSNLYICGIHLLNPYKIVVSHLKACFSKDTVTTGPDNLPRRLTGNFTGTGIAFLEAPVTFPILTGSEKLAGCYQSLTRASRSSAREGERLGTRRIRHKLNGSRWNWCVLKNTHQFNFEVIVLSKERGDRHCAWSVGCKWWSIAFVERFEQQSRSLVIFYDSSSYFRLQD